MSKEKNILNPKNFSEKFSLLMMIQLAKVICLAAIVFVTGFFIDYKGNPFLGIMLYLMLDWFFTGAVIWDLQNDRRKHERNKKRNERKVRRKRVQSHND